MLPTDPEERYLLKEALNAAIEGGIRIMEVYSGDFSVDYKADDSPLTLADRSAHETISHCLAATGIPILSEEGKDIPYEKRKDWKQFWLVDPLDGTKEFIKRNGEFTVNIALIRDGAPVLGVILVPVSGQLYFGITGTGAFKTSVDKLIPDNPDKTLENAVRLPSDYDHGILTVVCSRSHLSPETAIYIESLQEKEPGLQFVSIGSSLKMCLVAEGKARVYPRFGPTMEWDTAAGHAIVNASGGKVLQFDSHTPLNYNKASLLNPWFIASR